MKLEELVGQQIMIGVPETRATPSLIHLFRETHAGGLIIFRPNFASVETFQMLLSDLENALGRRLTVAVDHEGGRVIHLAGGVTVFPDNLVLGNTKDKHYAERQGLMEAQELRRLGIDLNLAPTLDVLTEGFSPNIGIRSYGKDPNLVAELGAARIKAMQAGGLSACAKHFPGQGHSPLDAHVGLPVLPTTWDEMKKIHIKPFLAAMKAGVHTVMTSHPVYPNLDKRQVPATFSKKIVQDYLRDELGYKGVILTDDLEMGALTGLCSVGESAVRALEAGHDMVLICHKEDAQREAYDAILSAYQNGRLKIADLETSVDRLQKLNHRRRHRFETGKPQKSSEGAQLALEIAQKGIIVSSKDHFISETEKAESLVVIFPRISVLANRIFIEDEILDEKIFLDHLLKAKGFSKFQSCIVGLDPPDHEIQDAAFLAGQTEKTILFCFDAHLFQQDLKLLRAVQATAKKLAVVFLRDPYDIEYAASEAMTIQACGFRTAQIQAAFNYLLPG